jgi:hypothetical protein
MRRGPFSTDDWKTVLPFVFPWLHKVKLVQAVVPPRLKPAAYVLHRGAPLPAFLPVRSYCALLQTTLGSKSFFLFGLTIAWKLKILGK